MTRSTDGARLVLTTLRGSELTHEALAHVRRGVGGVVIEPLAGDPARATSDPAAIAHVIAELKRRADQPLIAAASHEGGRHAAVRHPFIELPDMGAVGLSGELKLAEAIGRVMGEELRAVGVDLNLAPVLDVDTREDNPFVGARSFGISPHICGAFGCGILEAMQLAGVAAAAKHFPGLGDLEHDPRNTIAALNHDRARMNRVELPPFFSAVSRGVAAMLVGQVRFDALDPDAPAAQSGVIIERVLRDEMAFGGLVIADDVTTPSATRVGDEPGGDAGDAAVRAVAAGADLVRVGGADRGVTDRVIDAIDHAIDDGRITPARLQNALHQIAALGENYIQPPPADPDVARIGNDDHRVVMEQVWRLAETHDAPGG